MATERMIMTTQHANDVRPGLKRVDSKPLDLRHEPDAFRKLIVSVDSVQYYTDERTGSRLSAVLLNVCFSLPSGDYLKSAILPLVARDNHGTKLDIEIYKHHPSDDEHITVKIENGEKHISFLPSLNVNAGVGGGSISGVGKEKNFRFEKEFSIKLSPKRVKYEPKPTELSWEFHGDKNTVYPSNIRLLLIVHGPNDDHKSDFPFHLYIQEELSVNTSKLGRLTRFFRKKHGGWYFDIHSVFDPQEAQKVRNSQRRDLQIGLRAAYLKAREGGPILLNNSGDTPQEGRTDSGNTMLMNVHVSTPLAQIFNAPSIQTFSVPGYNYPGSSIPAQTAPSRAQLSETTTVTQDGRLLSDFSRHQVTTLENSLNYSS